MADLFNPLASMYLRNDAGLRSEIGATFGSVRTNGDGSPKNHQGWDLYAPAGTDVFAIGDGVIVWTQPDDVGDYGRQILLQFSTDGSSGTSSAATRYAFYAHLSKVLVAPKEIIRAKAKIAESGVSGNAAAGYPHLHFEIRTSPAPLGKGLGSRVDPGEVLGFQLLSCRTQREDGVELVQAVCRAPLTPAKIAPSLW